jgi:hypothetical protein
MQNRALINIDDQEKLTEQSESLTQTVKKFPVPSYQDVLTKIQQQSINQDILLQEAEQDIAAIENVQNFTTLLQKDKEKAKLMIDSLVSSAKHVTSTITTAITSVPVHPYEKLIYEYLGPNHKPSSIEEYSIPNNFNPFSCIKDLRAIAEANQQLQLAQMAVLSAEAANPLFNGTFVTENLNNAFAEPINDLDGKKQFVVNEIKLKNHLEFMEMVKSIPKEYIFKNPLEVAKKMLSEFVRIHKPSQEIQIQDEIAVPSFTMQEVSANPLEVTKQLFSNYQQLNGPDNAFDFVKFFESIDYSLRN